MTVENKSAAAQKLWSEIELALLGRHASNAVVRNVALDLIDQAIKDARHGERLKFSGKPCRHTTDAECETDREDLRAWQTDQSEWFDATILEIVSEYAEWRDRRDAAAPSELAVIRTKFADFRKKVSDAMKIVSHSYGGIDELRNSMGRVLFSDFIVDDGENPIAHGIYVYKDKRYRVTGFTPDHLIQFEDEWHPAVSYVCEPENGKSFSRALPDFRAKFIFEALRGRTDNAAA